MNDGENSIEGRAKETTPSQWHQKVTLADGTPVGHLGSLQFILDEDGQPVSRGYHEIQLEDGEYVGRIGARRERIRVSRGTKQ